MSEELLSENEQIEVRLQKLQDWRAYGDAYPNDFKIDAFAKDLINKYDNENNEALEVKKIEVHIAGRIMTRRLMGKASFVHIQDQSGKIQIYIKADEFTEEQYNNFKTFDIGDIVGVTGTIFKTKTEELSVRASAIKLLAKALRPLPDKWHGLVSQEMRYRKRYLDLIMNESSRNIFRVRSRIITTIRQFLLDRHFIEVETPMMHLIPGGAAARPFVTHHNALDLELFLRIAPELHLKRLVVGGFERVFEINRNFRNEGVSTRHNPEFTMIEFYQAYADYEDLIILTEELFKLLADVIFNASSFQYLEHTIDFSGKFTRLSVKDAVLKYNPTLDLKDLDNEHALKKYMQTKNINLEAHMTPAGMLMAIFDATVEHNLIQPTFITEYPLEVSPLARKNNKDNSIVDRFEFYIAGREIANAFSELNDPEDQAMRFRAQEAAKGAGDLEAMHYDADYITALEYGLPPTAGEGIGIDRLVMLFTNSASIRDVLLFPLLRPEGKD